MCSVSLQIITLNRVESLRREVQDVRVAICWAKRQQVSADLTRVRPSTFYVYWR